MNRIQAYHNFWSGFGLTAYDGTTVPDNAMELNNDKYLTYEVADDSFEGQVALTVSLFYRSTSWKDIQEKEMEIANAITRGGKMIKYDGGAFWIKKDTPWAQRLSDTEDDTIRRIVLNI